MGLRAPAPTVRKLSVLTPRVIGLLRVSGERQVEGQSLDAQRRAIERYCSDSGYLLLRVAEEPGTTAFTAKLTAIPSLNQAILDIEAGLADILVYHESSRLARKLRLSEEIADRIDAAGGRFINLANPGVDYRTPEGRVQFGIEGTLNEYYSRKVSEHSRKGKQEHFEKGLPVGAIPFGYVSVKRPDGSSDRSVPPVIVAEEAAAIRQAFLDHALHRSPNDLAREWNAAGLKPRSVKMLDWFQSQTVRNILSNRFYCGYVIHHGEERHGVHEPVISEEEWQAAQHTKRPVKRGKHPPLLLLGAAKCGRCGVRLYPRWPPKSPKRPAFKYVYYLEPSKGQGRPCDDAGELWRHEWPDEHVDRLMQSLMFDPAWLRYVEEHAREVPDTAAPRREQLEASLRRVQKEYFHGRLSESDYEAARREFDEELAHLPSSVNAAMRAAPIVGSFAELWEGASPEVRNETIQIVFEEVLLFMSEERLELKPAPEFEPLFALRSAFCVSSRQPAQGSP